MKEVKERVLAALGKVYKIKCDSDHNLEKIIMSKLENKKLNKKIYERMIIELDLLYNSIYDNFESQSESSKLKLETLKLEIDDERPIEIP